MRSAARRASAMTERSIRRGLLLLALAAAACSRSPGSESRPAAPAPVPVTAAAVSQKAVPVQVRAIGTVQPSNTVTVRARVGGILAEVHFKEGQDVTEGQRLFTLDRGPLVAQLRQAEANLARSAAQLDQARRDAERSAELVKQGFIARQQYDQAVTQAAALDASVRADRAVVENARLQVDYASIRAPMSGRAGALLVHEGDLVKANDTALVVLNQLRPIDVAFALPQQQLPDVQRYRAEKTLAVEAVHPGAGQALGRGELTFIDNRVDPATGTIQLKATFPNTDTALWPGQFVDVVLTLTTEPAAIVVPTRAVQTGQQGRYVFVVTPEQTAEARSVRIARELGEESVVTEGLAPGETVVTEGQLRLTPGAKVEVKTATAAAAPAVR